MIIEHFKKNPSGRDFIVGDIHGCFNNLRSKMFEHHFDESCDRLFSVGDLVDRGPHSLESIDWIAKPWFHAVRGNHEDMAISVFKGEWDVSNYISNGGGWFTSIQDDRQQEFVTAFESLPLVMGIDTNQGVIGVVHAECSVNSWNEFLNEINDPDPEKSKRTITMALWGRGKISRGDHTSIEGVERVPNSSKTKSNSKIKIYSWNFSHPK